MPVGILALDQIDLPLTVPALGLLLAGDGYVQGRELLETNEAGDGVASGETFRPTGSRLVNARDYSEVRPTWIVP